MKDSYNQYKENIKKYQLENVAWVLRKIGFQKNYLTFKTKKNLDRKIDLKVDTNYGWSLFSSDVKKEQNFPIQNYFDGHIFNSSILCESFIECRDNTINVTSQLRLDLTRFSRKLNSSHKVAISQFPQKNVTTNLIKTISVVFSETDYAAHNGDKVFSANITQLVKKCSGFAIFKSFAIVMCMYKT